MKLKEYLETRGDSFDLDDAMAALDPEVDLRPPRLGHLLADLVYARSEPLLRTLVETHGMDVDATQGPSGYTMLWMAAYRNDEDVITMLLDLGADPTKRVGTDDTYPVWMESFFGLCWGQAHAIRAMLFHPRWKGKIDVDAERNLEPLLKLYPDAIRLLNEARAETMICQTIGPKN